MAARQASQSNAMLYSLITFVALFIVTTVLAVIFYVKSEEFRTMAEQNKSRLDSVAKSSESNQMERIVGKREQGTSYIGTMQKVIDDLYSMILGQQPPENLPATVKFNEISMRIDSLNKTVLGEDVNPALGPTGVSLLTTIEELKTKLDNARSEAANLNQIIQSLETDLEDETNKTNDQQEKFLAELENFQTEMNQIRDRFTDLQQDMQNATDEQIASFQEQLEAEQAKVRQKQLDLQEANAELDKNDALLDDALAKLKAIQPNANNEVQAYAPDARIVRVDLNNGIVYLDAGVNDRVYRGLTFAIYDRNKPIGEEGEGKAEIEVFQVTDQVSAARVVKSDKKNPIVKDDIVANLIWDRDTANNFIVAGEFDYNEDGRIDSDGQQRIIELIERWGGRVMDEITIDTDFVIIGTAPKTLYRPSQQELDIDPMAQQRYEMSLQKASEYDEILAKAGRLGIPVFNQKRFLYLIGYDTLVHKNPM